MLHFKKKWRMGEDTLGKRFTESFGSRTGVRGGEKITDDGT
jgi:hypothetical protein